MARVGLSFSDRSEISTASKAGWSVRRIARHLGRCPSPGALPVGDLAGASPELDEDPRLPGRDRRRQSAASAGSPAA
ncbi:helix-turn-helix domain-containing protein, partial [Propionibacterium freudenreichii]|uniref:helix-turn-helix domain-containing protein n=1 Tax=Propionibacterium freudenreichii TaxID=1744 RepID=UPI002550E1DE